MTRAAVILTLLTPLAAGASPSPKIDVSCTMKNHPYVISHYNHKELKPEDHDDFWIGGYNDADKGGCTIRVDDTVVYHAPLVTAHPTEFRDAMVAIDEFRKVKAAEILRGMK